MLVGKDVIFQTGAASMPVVLTLAGARGFVLDGRRVSRTALASELAAHGALHDNIHTSFPKSPPCLVVVPDGADLTKVPSAFWARLTAFHSSTKVMRLSDYVFHLGH